MEVSLTIMCQNVIAKNSNILQLDAHQIFTKFLYGKENYALNLFICLGVTYSNTEWSACIMFTDNFQHFDMSR